MNQALSKNEMDALLSAISDDNISEEKMQDNLRSQKVKIYDFKRPEKFSKDQLRTLQMMHENFARLTTNTLSAQLRCLTSVHLASLEQLTYEEYIRSLSSPAIIGVIGVEPLYGSVLFEISSTVANVIIERLFGGPGDSVPIQRELSDIEMSAIESIILRILSCFRESWSTVVDLRTRLSTIETNPQFAQIVPPNDMVVLISFDIKIGETEGMANLCIPYITIESIISKLAAGHWYSLVRRVVNEEDRRLIQNSLDGVDMDVVCQVGEVDLRLDEFLKVQAGDVLRLGDLTIHSEMILKVNGVEKFKCRPGKRGSQLCVQLGQPIERITSNTEDHESSSNTNNDDSSRKASATENPFMN